MDIHNNGIKKVAFTGHKAINDDSGLVKHRFYYVFDTKKYDCELELYEIYKDKNLNLKIKDEKNPVATYPMDKGAVEIKMNESELGFAYRFKMTNKKNGKVSYGFDNGTVYNIFNNTEDCSDKFNIVLNNRSIVNKNGPMQIIMPDSYYPGADKGVEASRLTAALRARVLGKTDGFDEKTLKQAEIRENALKAVRTHANKLGGNFYGIIARLPEIEKEGIKRIVGTPYTKDSVSSHFYWTENAYQIAPTVGTVEDFNALQVELFKHGINWVADAALVNEGFGGIHFKEFLRKGEDSYANKMFTSLINKGEIKLGVLPETSEHTRMKIINAPFEIVYGEYKNKNPHYDPSKPTYIQLYDDRLVSGEGDTKNNKGAAVVYNDGKFGTENQRTSDSYMRATTYDVRNPENTFGITKHDDAVYPFAFEVNPDRLRKNIEEVFKEQGSVNLADIDTIRRIAQFENFAIETKSKNAGLTLWDGNVDIAKLNFSEDTFGDTEMEQAELAVKEYALNSGKYWTKTAGLAQLKYASGLFASEKPGKKTAEEYLTMINRLIGEGKLPKEAANINIDNIRNAMDGRYALKTLYSVDKRSSLNPEAGFSYYKNDYILKKAVDVPLETMPFSSNLLGILTSPYIQKKPYTSEELGISRYDTMKADNPNLPEKYAKLYGKSELFYLEKLTPFISGLFEDIPGITDAKNRITPYGKYLMSEIVPDLTKYIITKSLAPNAPIEIDENGNFDFSKVNPENTTMQSLGMRYAGMTDEEEAEVVLKLLFKGIEKVGETEFEKLQNAVNAAVRNRTAEDFKVAEMILDRTESGLGWRIDAAKDVGSIDYVSHGTMNMDRVWDDVIDFWKRYAETVKQENPHVYTTAELTDLAELFRGSKSEKYLNDGEAERKFLQETGITSIVNYNYFFSLLPEMYAKVLREGSVTWMAPQEKTCELENKLDEGWTGNPGFLFQSPREGVINSYTFIGNHDKPRALHDLSLDRALYISDLKSSEHRAEAAKVLQREVEDIDFEHASAKAIAVGAGFNKAFDSFEIPEEIKIELKSAVADLAGGSYKGEPFNAEAFGARPFEISLNSVFEQAEYNGAVIPADIRKKIEAKTMENILVPALDRLSSIIKLLTVLPGSPTDFAGDRTGLTGYEEKAKNYLQQNRNVIRWEWLDDPDYKFIADAYAQINKISNLRQDPKLSALNDGDTVTLPLINRDENGKLATYTDGGVKKHSRNDYITAIMRYNDKGSIVLAFTNNKGANTPYYKRPDRSGSENPERTVVSDKNNKVYLFDNDLSNRAGLKFGLEEGLIFRNPNDSNNVLYVTGLDETGYYLQKRIETTDKTGKKCFKTAPTEIEPKDINTLVLYNDGNIDK